MRKRRIKMGADLYIKNLDRQKQYTGFRTDVEVGYFRDCYNSYGLFNFLRSNLTEEYSWWAFNKKRGWFNRDRELTVKGAEKLLKLMESAKERLIGRGTYFLKIWNPDTDHDDTKKLSRDETIEYMTWLDQLIEFLHKAIELRSPVIWSV